MFSTETITNFATNRDAVARRRYGMIETAGGRLVRIVLSPWPKAISWPELWPVGPRFHGSGPADRCRLYYNQPRRLPNFLALKYMVTTHGTSYATFCKALEVLDAVAELKQTDAMVCDASNARISDRLMRRFGWESHKPQRWHRNYIRRFYGTYPGSLAAFCADTCHAASRC